MKYLFINSVAGIGSTGRLAAEQCRQLKSQGHSCVLAYGREAANCDGIVTHPIGNKLSYQLHGLRCRLLDDHGFGSRRATLEFLDWVRRFDPDVIWLHNVHGYYIHLGLLFDYLRSSGKTIYWTLHDCWSFTGHCAHFSYVGCDRWKTGCHHCPQKGIYPKSILRDNSAWNYQKKRELFTGIPNLTLILPSHWLESRVAESFLQDYPRQVVHNPIDREIFRPTPSDFSSRWQLEGKKIVLGVASVWGERKGLEDFLALAKMLPEGYKIVLVGLNQKEMAALPREILGLPRTNSLQALAEIYTAADVYVNPSPEETFGMTTLEARCCGTPAVVYEDTGGEEVVRQYGGLAVPRGPEHLLEAILELTKEG